MSLFQEVLKSSPSDLSLKKSSQLLPWKQPPKYTADSLCHDCDVIFRSKSASQALSSICGLQYKRRRVSLIHSALNGCVLCRELLCMTYSPGLNPPVEFWASVLEKHDSRLLSSPYRKLLARLYDTQVRFCLRGDLGKEYFINVSRYQALHSRKRTKFEVSTRAGKSLKSTKRLLHILMEIDNSAAEHVSGRTINTDTGCQKTYEKIRKWLVTCKGEHKSCYLNESIDGVERPALVLDVSLSLERTDIIKLQFTKDLKGAPLIYAALSYCWGTVQPNALIDLNLESYLAGIQLSSLPKSLRDAVVVTRKLDIQYLWVDSLCIIQNSEEDKIHEIARMESIYSNAYVTISASCAIDCNAGFLGVQNPAKKSFTVPFRCNNGEVGQVSLSALGPSQKTSYAIPTEPIHSRAWTFQESFFSRRMIIYSKHQLFWVCGETWGKDGGRISREEYFSRELSSRSLREPKTDDWVDIICEYSSRGVTNASDKLPALSSIAAYFAKRTNDVYLAGLWRSKLLHELCWEPSRNEFLVGGAAHIQLNRPKAYRAPSWSFMSVEGKVFFQEEKNLNFQPKRNLLPFEVLEYNVTLASVKAPFGKVESASLKVRGYMAKTRIPATSPAPCDYLLRLPMLVTNKRGEFNTGHLSFDTAEKISQIGKGIYYRQADLKLDDSKYFYNNANTARMGEIFTNYGALGNGSPLWCLMLCTKKAYVTREYSGAGSVPGGEYRVDIWAPWGLVLAELLDGTYHRVGTFVARGRGALDYFSEQGTRTITLV